MNRSKRKTVAQETVRIMEAGSYTNLAGYNVSIKSSLDAAKAGTVVYSPDDLGHLEIPNEKIDPRNSIQIEVYNETTMAGAKQLLASGADRVAVAGIFSEVLNQNRYRSFFEQIRFSVLDTDDRGTYQAFAKQLN